MTTIATIAGNPVSVADWESGDTILSEKICEIFSAQFVSGDWDLQDYGSRGFTLQRRYGSTVITILDGEGNLTAGGESITIVSNQFPLDILRRLISAWD